MKDAGARAVVTRRRRAAARKGAENAEHQTAHVRMFRRDRPLLIVIPAEARNQQHGLPAYAPVYAFFSLASMFVALTPIFPGQPCLFAGMTRFMILSEYPSSKLQAFALASILGSLIGN
jgi:hypothetical protein